MQDAPLAIEFVTGLPFSMAPTVQQLIEMFPPMKPIKLSDKCVKQLASIHEVVGVLDKLDGMRREELDSVLTYGDTIQDVMSNPEILKTDMDTFDAILRVKKSMGSAAMEKRLLVDMLGNAIGRIKWRLVTIDLLTKYPDARFDVTDYLNLVHNKRTNEVMVYAYTMPGYRFKSARSIVHYNKLGEVITDDSPDEAEATAWARIEDDE